MRCSAIAQANLQTLGHPRGLGREAKVPPTPRLPQPPFPRLPLTPCARKCSSKRLPCVDLPQRSIPSKTIRAPRLCPPSAPWFAVPAAVTVLTCTLPQALLPCLACGAPSRNCSRLLLGSFGMLRCCSSSCCLLPADPHEASCLADGRPGGVRSRRAKCTGMLLRAARQQGVVAVQGCRGSCSGQYINTERRGERLQRSQRSAATSTWRAVQCAFPLPCVRVEHSACCAMCCAVPYQEPAQNGLLPAQNGLLQSWQLPCTKPRPRHPPPLLTHTHTRLHEANSSTPQHCAACTRARKLGCRAQRLGRRVLAELLLLLLPGRGCGAHDLEQHSRIRWPIIIAIVIGKHHMSFGVRPAISAVKQDRWYHWPAQCFRLKVGWVGGCGGGDR